MIESSCVENMFTFQGFFFKLKQIPKIEFLILESNARLRKTLAMHNF